MYHVKKTIMRIMRLIIQIFSYFFLLIQTRIYIQSVIKCIQYVIWKIQIYRTMRHDTRGSYDPTS